MASLRENVYLSVKGSHNANPLSARHFEERQFLHCWLFSLVYNTGWYTCCYCLCLEWFWNYLISSSWSVIWIWLLCYICDHKGWSSLHWWIIWASVSSWIVAWASTTNHRPLHYRGQFCGTRTFTWWLWGWLLSFNRLWLIIQESKEFSRTGAWSFFFSPKSSYLPRLPQARTHGLEVLSQVYTPNQCVVPEQCSRLTCTQTLKYQLGHASQVTEI